MAACESSQADMGTEIFASRIHEADTVHLVFLRQIKIEYDILHGQNTRVLVRHTSLHGNPFQYLPPPVAPPNPPHGTFMEKSQTETPEGYVISNCTLLT